MINTRRSFSLCFTVLILTLLISGCAETDTYMRPVPSDNIVVGPENGKAMIVFMRPSGVGGGIYSHIFEIKEDKPLLIGTVSGHQKISYQLEPGKHHFMVASSNADFITAELTANKTYYARITPVMGRWRGRFSLNPIPIKLLYSSQFNTLLEECEWVEKSPDSNTLADSNITSIQSNYEKYYAEWRAKDASQRFSLHPRDGK